MASPVLSNRAHLQVRELERRDAPAAFTVNVFDDPDFQGHFDPSTGAMQNGGSEQGDVSLRSAVAALDLSTDSTNTINFASAGTYTLTQGQLVITKSVTITGTGADPTDTSSTATFIVNGNGSSSLDTQTYSFPSAQDRIFDFQDGSSHVIVATLSSMTIKNGFVLGGSDGNNHLDSQGGGIRFIGNVTGDSLTITNCDIRSNTANAVVGADDSNGVAYNDGKADGGGIFTEKVTLTISNSDLMSNTATGQQLSTITTYDALSQGGESRGGALYHDGGAITLTGDQFTSNVALGGVGAQGADTSIGGNADGGGLFVGNQFSNGPFRMTDCEIDNNQANGGAGLSGADVSGGDGSDGGAGVMVTDAIALRCAFVGNVAGGAGTFTGYDSQTGGTARAGAGTVARFVDVTMSGNHAIGGYAFASSEPGTGGPAYGGAVDADLLPGGVQISNSTIAGNTASGGKHGFVAAADYGDGVYSGDADNRPAVLYSTIVALNRNAGGLGTDIYGGATEGRNLIGAPDPSSTNFPASQYNSQTQLFSPNLGTGDLVGSASNRIDPKFIVDSSSAPILAHWGGPTLTYALSPASQALDNGGNQESINGGEVVNGQTVPLQYDQRGPILTRSYALGPVASGYDGTDIGAYEEQPPTVENIIVNGGAAQRSEVTSITVVFSEPVTFSGSGGAVTAFALNHVNDSTIYFTSQHLVSLGQATVGSDAFGRTTVTLTFAANGAETDAPSALNGGPQGGPASLADGRYQLAVDYTQVTDAFGERLYGTAGANSNYTSPLDTAGSGSGHFFGLYRIYGDSDGNGVDDSVDLSQFRSAFNASSGNSAYVWYLDSDNSGAIDTTDLSYFRSHFNQNVFHGP